MNYLNNKLKHTSMIGVWEKDTFQIFIASLFLILGLGCSKDDSSTTPLNFAPEAFNLTSVSNNAVNVNLLPTLAWETAIDPEDDAVTYDLFLGTDSNPSEIFAEDLITPSYTLQTSLSVSTTYNWQVVAKDSFGNSTSSPIFSFSTRPFVFNQLASPTSFDARSSHEAIAFNNNLWVIGGNSNSLSEPRLNDLWKFNGSSWSENSTGATFISARSGHKCVVFDNQLWLVGGYDGNNLNDVWTTSNGASWSEVTTNTNSFSPRAGHAMVVFNDKIWLIGGLDNTGPKNDVWSSSDGSTWILEPSNVSFPARYFHTATVFNDKIWIIGGRDNSGLINDMWSSTNGVDWVQSTVLPSFLPRAWHTTTVLGDTMYVVAGFSSFGDHNDIWKTKDGEIWEQVTTPPFIQRSGHSVTEFNGKLWLIGGSDDINQLSNLNDIWRID